MTRLRTEYAHASCAIRSETESRPTRGDRPTDVRHRGIQLRSRLGVDRTLAAQALLAGIAERGADAVGYAHRAPGRPARGRTSSDAGASALLDASSCPADATAGCSSTCATTRRAIPSIAANNHPVRHGPVVGIHNGIILNDDELFARYGFARAEPRDDRRLGGDLRAHGGAPSRPARALEQLARRDGRGLDRRARRRRTLYARARGRATALDRPRRGARCSSPPPKSALEVVEALLRA